MMNTPMSINDLSHENICIWLKRALRGEELLPQLTTDEHPHLGILRLEKTLWPTTRRSISDGCLELIRQFSADGVGDDAYLQELLFLTAALKNPEAVRMLAQLAARFPEMRHVSEEVRLAVLAALVDTPPPQPAAFWDGILKQDSEKYAGLALSALMVYLSIRGIDFQGVADGFQTIHYGYVLPALALLFLMQLLRSFRWGLILSPLAKIERGSDAERFA